MYTVSRDFLKMFLSSWIYIHYCSDQTMNKKQTKIKVEVLEFGYHLVQWLKFV